MPNGKSRNNRKNAKPRKCKFGANCRDKKCWRSHEPETGGPPVDFGSIGHRTSSDPSQLVHTICPEPSADSLELCVYKCSYRISRAQRTYLENNCPWLKIVVQYPGRTAEHPLLAIQRAVSEAEIIDDLMRNLSNDDWILDVGGNALRHAARGRANVWSCCPPLSATDSIRNARYVDAGIGNYCHCLAQQCDCQSFTCAIFIHSAYYCTPEQIVEILLKTSKRMAFSAMHIFDQPVGFFGVTNPKAEDTKDRIGSERSYEASYEVYHLGVGGDDDARVRMKVGLEGSYDHSAMSWLLRSDCIQTPKGVLGWRYVRRVAETHIYEFRIIDDPVIPQVQQELSFVQSLHPSSVGQIALHDVMAISEIKGTPLISNLRSVVSMRDSLSFFYQDGKEIYIPKAMIHIVASNAAGRRRDELTLTSCFNWAKTAANKYNFPEAHKPDAIVIAAVLGYNLTVGKELKALNAMSGSWVSNLALNSYYKGHWTYGLLIESLAPLYRVLNMFLKIAVPLTIITICIYLLAFLSHQRRAIKVGLSFYLPLAIILFVLAFLRWLTDSGRDWFNVIFNRDLPPPGDNGGVVRGPGYHAPDKGNDVPTNDSLHIVNRFPDPPSLDLKIRIQSIGPYVANYRPEVTSQIKNNKLQCIKYRAGAQRLPLQKDALAYFSAMEEQHWDDIYPGLAPGSVMEPTPFDQFISKYPASQQKSLLEAKQVLDSGNWTAKQMLQKSSFMKVEKILKLNPDSQEDWKPRLITSCTPLFLAFIGPWIDVIHKRLNECWNGSNFIVYADGMSVEQLGAIYDLSTHNGANSSASEDDFTNFDGSQCRELLENEYHWYRKLGMPEQQFQVLMESIKGKVHMNPAISYTKDGTRDSGVPHTGTGNSRWDGAGHYVGLMHDAFFKHEDHKYVQNRSSTARMFVCGDDNLLTGDTGLVQLDPTTFLRQLGLSCKRVVRETVEDTIFLNRRFWPVVIDGQLVHVLGPRPGRVLSKIGWDVTMVPDRKRHARLRAVALSMQFECSFVPILHCLIAKILELTHELTPYELKKDYRQVHAKRMLIPCQQAYDMANSLYGVDVIEAERIISGLKTLDVELGDPIFQHICRRDNL